MKSIYRSFVCSSKELKSVKNLVLVSLLLSMKLILNMFTVQFTQYLHLSFNFLVDGVIGVFFGPAIGGLCGGMSDIINYVTNPTGPFFPGFTLSAVITGIIYGIGFYKKDVTMLRCFLVELSVCIIINLLLTTLWLSMLYGNSFFALLPVRVFKNILTLPINTMLLYVVLTSVKRIKVN